METRNQTRQDALDLIATARIGSLAGNPSPAFLEALSNALLDWSNAVDTARWEQMRAEAAREEKALEIRYMATFPYTPSDGASAPRMLVDRATCGIAPGHADPGQIVVAFGGAIGGEPELKLTFTRGHETADEAWYFVDRSQDGWDKVRFRTLVLTN